MQAKDLDEIAILNFLDDLRVPALLFDAGFPNDLYQVVSREVPRKVLLAKMNALIRRNLVKGCSCGCRGDFLITEEGRRFLKTHQ